MSGFKKNQFMNFFKGFIAVIILTLMLFSLNSFAIGVAPNGINYQAAVRNSSGQLVINQGVWARFSIHSDSINGTVVYQETDSSATSPQGIFTVVIGGGNIKLGTSLNDIAWPNTKYFLQVEMDVTGGSNYVDLSTTQLVSVPYAFHASTATFANTAANVALNTGTKNVTGNDSIEVNGNNYIVVNSTVMASGAVQAISPGQYVGQLLYLLGDKGMGSNGVRFLTNSLIDVGSGNTDLKGGDALTLFWNGSSWIRLAYSSNQ